MIDDAKIPDEYICPLTLEIMDKPLMNRYGHNFERDAILACLFVARTGQHPNADGGRLQARHMFGDDAKSV